MQSNSLAIRKQQQLTKASHVANNGILPSSVISSQQKLSMMSPQQQQPLANTGSAATPMQMQQQPAKSLTIKHKQLAKAIKQ